MSASFTVSMYLRAYNQMAPQINSAIRAMNSLGTTVRNVASRTQRINPVQGWEEKINVVAKKMQNVGKQAEDLKKKSEKMMASGTKNLASAAAVSLPVLGAMKASADIQTMGTTMNVMGFSEEGIQKVKRQSLDLAKAMAFDWNQVMGVALALQKAGMNEVKVMASQGVITKYAQLEYNRYGSDPFQTATHLAHIAETAGVLYVTAAEKEKHALNTQAKMDAYVVNKLSNMAEYLNKVVAATSADTATIAESLKYSMPEGKMLGWSEQQVMMMTGVQSRFGIEGSMAGTHLKDFSSRLNPFQHYVDEDAGKRSTRLTAMMAAGWIKDVAYTTSKLGFKRFYRVGESAFHDKAGNLKGPEEIFRTIAESYEKFKAEGKSLQFFGILHDILGEQGKGIAQLLSKNPEMIKHLTTDMSKVMSIEQGIARYQKDANTAWDIFKGNVRSVGIMLGDLVLPDTAATLQNINSRFFGGMDQEGNQGIYAWIDQHQELIKTVMKAMLMVAAFTATIGVAKIAAAGMALFVLTPFMRLIGVLGWMVKRGLDLKVAFDLVRATGAGSLASVWRGAKLAWPWLEKLSGLVWQFGGRWMITALRIAAGWIIAMGPVGWIIAGVTAVIVAATWAWNNNFLGFRDKAKAVWSWISDYIDFICPGITEALAGAINFMKAIWTGLRIWVGQKWDEIKMVINIVLTALSPAVKQAATLWKSYFADFAQNAKEQILNIMKFFPGVKLAIGIKEHLDDFEKYRATKRNSIPEGYNTIPKMTELENKSFVYRADNTPVVPQGGGNRNYYFNITNNNDISSSDPERAGESVAKLSIPKYFKESLDPSFG